MSKLLDHEVVEKWMEDVDDKRKAWHVPGCAMAVIQDTEVIFSKGFGHLQLGSEEQVSRQTLFPIASATKPFTALGLAMLVEDGLLDWDTPLQTYWPEFRLYDAIATNRTTVRDLLCHRTGLPRHDLVWYQTPFARAELMERLRYLEPTKDFRAAYQYQNLMYTAAGFVIEKISSLTWEQFTRERILDRLGMESTRFSLADAQQVEEVARPYMSIGNQVVEVPYLNNEVIGPAGSMISSLEDMTKWLKYQLHSQADLHGQLLPSRRHAELRTPHMFSGSRSVPYPEIPITGVGLGWFIQIYRGEKMVYHAGNIQGFSSLVSFIPERNCAVVVLSQVDNSRLPAVLTYEAYDRLLGGKQADWHNRLKKEAEIEEEQQRKNAESLRPVRSMSENQPVDKPRQVLPVSLVGTYHHLGYGQIIVMEEAGTLCMRYHDMHFSLELIGENQIVASYLETYRLMIPITFHTDPTGAIVSLSAKMEPSIGANEIMFTRI
ncbi:serine hydrolase domain-containing protein [Brevibacillus reuszeri]|uniref:serine hydrolase domain-containing protein n=1 Tax=Brevibacillus reuszeri TaxID=54915 RepID=UPI003D20B522